VYAVNGADDARGVPGFLVGRYPNDTYDGYETGSVGNPWILATNAMGELYYRLVN
jgi:glucoamylase